MSAIHSILPLIIKPCPACGARPGEAGPTLRPVASDVRFWHVQCAAPLCYQIAGFAREPERAIKFWNSLADYGATIGWSRL